MWHLAADCGEDPSALARDQALLGLVEQVHIACGGHAGDAASAQHWAEQAAAAGCDIVLHPSLPDRQHHGRVWIDLPRADLRQSLTTQRDTLPDCQAVKLHGALYNRAQDDHGLAAWLADWLVATDIIRVTTLADGALARAARARGIAVQAEGFLDRGYQKTANGLRLVPRHEPGALITDGDAWRSRLHYYAAHGSIITVAGAAQPVPITSWCIHADTPGALDNLRQLRACLETVDLPVPAPPPPESAC